VGAGGTLGSAAYTATTAYEVPLTFTTGLTRSTNTVTVNTSQAITTLSALTSNGFVKTSGSTGLLSVDTSSYLTTNQNITLSGAVTGSGTTAITTTLASGQAQANLTGGTGALDLTGFTLSLNYSQLTGSPGSGLLAANNLSDLASASTARTNLGLGAAALLSATVGGDLSGTIPNPTVVKINGVTLSGLATGFLFNTTSTGVPSIATIGHGLALTGSTVAVAPYDNVTALTFTPALMTTTGIDTTAGAVAITLPTATVTGQWFKIFDIAANWATHNVSVGTSGNTFYSSVGSAVGPYVLNDTQGQGAGTITFVWNNTLTAWVVI